MPKFINRPDPIPPPDPGPTPIEPPAPSFMSQENFLRVHIGVLDNQIAAKIAERARLQLELDSMLQAGPDGPDTQA